VKPAVAIRLVALSTAILAALRRHCSLKAEPR
jgi:hypothetical protein